MISKEIKCIPEEGMLKASDLRNCYVEFKKPISNEGLQESKGALTKKGYDTLGYGYAWLTERLNDVVGGHWRIVETNNIEKEHTSAKGNLMYGSEVDIVVQLGNWQECKTTKTIVKMENDETIRVVEEIKTKTFEVLDERVGFGGHKALSRADARKGAYTNGFKKAVGMFGVGNDAYKACIDEENQEVKDVLSTQNKPKTANIISETVKRAKKLLADKGAKNEAEAIALLKEKGLDFKSLKNISEAQAKLILFKIK